MPPTRLDAAERLLEADVEAIRRTAKRLAELPIPEHPAGRRRLALIKRRYSFALAVLVGRN